MDLKKHAALEHAPLDFRVDVDHGNLNHVGGRALNRSIDGIALGGAAQSVIGGADVADITAAAGDGLHVLIRAGESDGVVHVTTDAGELEEILLNDVAGFGTRDAKALGQAKRGDAVCDAVI